MVILKNILRWNKLRLRGDPHRSQRLGNVLTESLDVDIKRFQRHNMLRDPSLSLRVLGARDDVWRRVELVEPRSLLGKQDAIENTAPDRDGPAQGIGHLLAPPRRIDDDAAVVPADDGQEVEIESPRAEIPLSRVAIGALEVRGAGLVLRVDVPAPAPLVRDQWAPEASATSLTKSASCLMERRRLEMDKLALFRSVRMREKLWFACGEKIKSDSVAMKAGEGYGHL